MEIHVTDFIVRPKRLKNLNQGQEIMIIHVKHIKKYFQKKDMEPLSVALNYKGFKLTTIDCPDLEVTILMQNF